MKIILGLLLVVAAAAFAFPLAENDEKAGVPLVNAESPSAAVPKVEGGQQQQQQQHVQHVHHDEAAEATEQATDKPKLTENKSDESSNSNSNESVSSDESHEEKVQHDEEAVVADPVPKVEAKREEPVVQEKAADEPKPEATTAAAVVEAASEPAMADDVEEKQQEPVPAVKLLPEAAPKGEAAVPVAEKVDDDKVVDDEKVEKPLALPVEDDIKTAPTEIKEQAILPSEQKVESGPTIEEKLPELKTTPAIEKKPLAAEAELTPKAAVSDAGHIVEKKAKAEEVATITKPEPKIELAAKPADEKTATIASTPAAAQPEKKLDEAKDLIGAKTDAVIPEKLPEPSASS